MNLLAFVRSFIFTFIVFPLTTFFFSLASVGWYALTGKRTVVDWCSHNWGKLVMWFLGIRLEERGRQNLPAGGCLFLFNHTSFLDIFAMLSKLPRTRFGAKIELYSIPVFNLAMRAAGNLPIARNSREEAIQVLRDAEERARQGERFALAPEGARNHEEILLPFKAGPFIFAIQSGIPIVPVVIRGASTLWPKHSLLPCASKLHSDITMEYLPPVSPEGFTIENRAQLAEKVRSMMLPYFQGANDNKDRRTSI